MEFIATCPRLRFSHIPEIQFQSLVGSGVYCDLSNSWDFLNLSVSIPSREWSLLRRTAGSIVLKAKFQSLVGSGVYCDSGGVGLAVRNSQVSIPSREWSLLRLSIVVGSSYSFPFQSLVGSGVYCDMDL